MKTMMELMKEAAAEAGVAYSWFDQCLYLNQPEFGAEQRKGVCTALSLRWIKSSHKHGFFKSARYEKRAKRNGQQLHKPALMGFGGGHASAMSQAGFRQKMNDLQGDYETGLRTGLGNAVVLERAERDVSQAGAFGKLNARIIYAEKVGEDPSKVGASGGPKGLFEQRPPREFQFDHAAKQKADQAYAAFMVQVGAALAKIEPTQAMLVGLSFQGRTNGHSVAVARSQKEFMFFDPNAGMLSFKGANCCDRFATWFGTNAAQADTDHYHIIKLVELVKFQLSAGALPPDPMLHWAQVSTASFLPGSMGEDATWWGWIDPSQGVLAGRGGLVRGTGQ